MLLIYLNIDFLTADFTAEMVQKVIIANGSPTCELHSPHLGCGLKLIFGVYRDSHAHSFVLKHVLQCHDIVRIQHISTLNRSTLAFD